MTVPENGKPHGSGHREDVNKDTAQRVLSQLRAASSFIWIVLVYWTGFSIWMILNRGAFYGALLLIGGFFAAWDRVREHSPTDQEERAAEEGLVPIVRARWVLIGYAALVAVYGLALKHDPNALLIVFYIIDLLRDSWAQFEEL